MKQRTVIYSERIQRMIMEKIRTAPLNGTKYVVIGGVEDEKTLPQLKAFHAVCRDISMQWHESGQELHQPEVWKEHFKTTFGIQDQIINPLTAEVKTINQSLAKYTKRQLHDLIDNTVHYANAEIGLNIVIDPAIRAQMGI